MRILKDISIKALSNFSIGGTASLVIVPENMDDFLDLCRSCTDIPVIAGGSNTLIKDKRYERIIHLAVPFFSPRKISPGLIEVSAPEKVSALIKHFGSNDMGGIEFMAGVPSVTIGGAICQNFGAFDKTISELVYTVNAVIDDKVVTLSREECGFNYRTSLFKKDKIRIVSAVLRHETCEKAVFNTVLKSIIRERKSKQPLNHPNIGSIFKNPPGKFAGQLIEDAGLKGMTAGGAAIWAGHANFIINVKDATCADVLQLMDAARRAVKNRHNILLEPEITILE